MRVFKLLMAAIAFLIAVPTNAGSIIFSESEFDDGFEFRVLGTGLIQPAFSPSLSGGNPDSYLLIGAGPLNNTASFEHWNLTIFTGFALGSHATSTLAGIASLSFSMDVNSFGKSDSSMEIGLALTQGDNLFLNRWLLGPGVGWVNKSRDALTPGDFVAITRGGGFTNSITPDFSTQGATIRFGVYVRNIAPPNTTSTDDFVGLDNWRVQVNFVPEPTTFALSYLASGAFFALYRRRVALSAER